MFLLSDGIDSRADWEFSFQSLEKATSDNYNKNLMSENSSVVYGTMFVSYPIKSKGGNGMEPRLHPHPKPEVNILQAPRPQFQDMTTSFLSKTLYWKRGETDRRCLLILRVWRGGGASEKITS